MQDAQDKAGHSKWRVWYPKKLLEWNEPKIVRQVIHKAAPRRRFAWFRKDIFFGIMLASAIQVAFLLFGSDRFPTTERLLLVLAVTFAFYVLLGLSGVLLGSFSGRTVAIHEDGIVVYQAQERRHWKLERIRYGEILPIETPQGIHHVLTLHLDKGGPVMLGLAPDIIPQAAKTLHDLDVPLDGYMLQAAPSDTETASASEPDGESEVDASS